MIWAILLALGAGSPVLGMFLLLLRMRAEARDHVIIREDCGFGGNWK